MQLSTHHALNKEHPLEHQSCTKQTRLAVDRLRYIIFQGGEPLLVKEFDRILDVLISNGSASEVTFEIVSNLTTIKDSTLAKLAHLKQILLGASIDGIGPTLEYIRYPAVWAEIERNIERFAALPNVVI